MDETLFRELFTDHVDVLFAFHGYPGAIHMPRPPHRTVSW
jgi:xylulose-5-phosphate/fructose-6-phosphate phosphoketolase